VQIVAMTMLAWRYDLGSDVGQRQAVWALSWCVLVAGGLQVLMLVPSLWKSGFRFRLVTNLWTPQVKQMLMLSVPVAISASVLQIGVLLDKQISFMLSARDTSMTANWLGVTFAYPMAEGAVNRLNLAQFMYQFPLGVFAIALATALFPKLSADAVTAGKTVEVNDTFRATLRRGIESSLLIGLPASAGMILIALPAARLLFEGGKTTFEDSKWIALSTMIYAGAIWAFGLQQILNRAFYALHDARTPLVWTAVNLLLNLVVEIPLAFTPLGESAMAMGTLVSFLITTSAMLLILARKT
jgi:putative peptidoglycan lipid II flippase